MGYSEFPATFSYNVRDMHKTNMDANHQSKKIFAKVGNKVLWRCSQCDGEGGVSESERPVTAVAKWICPKCGTLNQFEIEFRAGAN